MGGMRDKLLQRDQFAVAMTCGFCGERVYPNQSHDCKQKKEKEANEAERKEKEQRD